MKKTACTLLCLALALWMGTASACTSIIVGREVSADGSLLVGRNEDIYTAYNKNFFVNPATEGEGTVTLTDPINGFTIELPATRAALLQSEPSFLSCCSAYLRKDSHGIW